MQKIIIKRVCYGFSAFKSKFQKVQSINYDSAAHFYDGLTKFQSELDYIEKLKYKKALPELQKKILKMYTKQLQTQANNQQRRAIWQIKSQLSTSITYQIFYSLQSKQLQPINQQMQLKLINLAQLHQLLGKTDSNFVKNQQIAIKNLLSNSTINQQLYEHVKTRSGYLQDQLAAVVFDGYDVMLKQMQEQANQENMGNSLKKLKGKKSKETVFKSDFKFQLKSNTTSEQNLMASQIAKNITKYSFASDKIKMFSIKSLSNEGFRSLTPASLANHLFILGYYKESVPQLNEKLYKIFDVLNGFSKHQDNIDQRQGKIGTFNSLLFYLLSNKIQIFQMLKQTFQKVLTGLKDIDLNRMNQNKTISTFDSQLFFAMIRLLKLKYELSVQSFQKDLNLKQDILNLYTIQNMIKRVQKVTNNSHQDFQNYLNRRKYAYSKHSIFSQQPGLNTVTQDQLYKVDDKNLICLGQARFNKHTERLNGPGEIIMDCFKAQSQAVKIINPIVVKKCQRRSQKQDYFKSKMKGVKDPQISRSRRFDF